MTKIKKTVLSLAVAAAVGGAISSANAVNLATDGLGDVLLYPYYTARNGWNTLIHLVNTSSTSTIAVKVRFQEAQNTRDVLDFTLVLSPNDVWTGYVTNTSSGPRLKKSSGETTCTSPVMPDTGFAFSTYAFGGGTDDDSVARTEEGHITVIEMGTALTGTAIDTAAKAKDCTTIDTAFTRANIDATSDQFGEPINALKGQFSLVRVNAGLAMGGSPVTLANFFTPTIDYAGAGTDGETVAVAGGGVAANYGVTNLITAQAYPDFLLPTLNDANPLMSFVQNDTQEALQATLIDTWTNPVDAVSAVLMRSNVVNEWSINPALGVESYWVVSFPTKFHYVDANAQPTATEIAAMVGPPTAANAAYVGTLPPFTTLWTDSARSCDTVTFQVYDRSEGGAAATGTSISPAPPNPSSALCNEVNVLSFSSSANLLESAVAQAVDVSVLTSSASYGWLDLKLPVTAGVNELTATNTYNGLPVTGFVLWSRDFGVASNNYGHLVDHAYKRTVAAP